MLPVAPPQPSHRPTKASPETFPGLWPRRTTTREFAGRPGRQDGPPLDTLRQPPWHHRRLVIPDLERVLHGAEPRTEVLVAQGATSTGLRSSLSNSLELAQVTLVRRRGLAMTLRSAAEVEKRLKSGEHGGDSSRPAAKGHQATTGGAVPGGHHRGPSQGGENGSHRPHDEVGGLGPSSGLLVNLPAARNMQMPAREELVSVARLEQPQWSVWCRHGGRTSAGRGPG